MNSSTSRSSSARWVALALVWGWAAACTGSCFEGSRPATAPTPTLVTAPPAPAPAPLPLPVKRPRPNARDRFVRDSIRLAALRSDSLAHAESIRDSIARVDRARVVIVRERWVRDSLLRADSLVREKYVRDSLARVAFAKDSAARDTFVQDSLARAAAIRDSLARRAREDSLFGKDGAMPRIQGDPNITRPTAAAQFDFVHQVWDNYQQVTLIYGRPFATRKASWEIDVPIQHWDSIAGGKSVTSFNNISLIVNRRLNTDSAGWRQTVSLTLSPQSSLVNPSVGNNQWIITPSYTISHWFASDRLHARLILYWQYGFALDTAAHPTKKNIIVPRVLLTGKLTRRIDATLDLRPRFDLTRNAFYSTLMVMLSRPIGERYGVQLGYEFPLDSMATQRVEKQRLYVYFSRVF